MEADKQAAVHFSLLCFLQSSKSLVLRGALPAFSTACCKWFSVPRCHHLGQTCTSNRWQISSEARRILDLTSLHQHPEPLPLPGRVKWLDNSRYRPTAGKSMEGEWGPTGRCILDGVQSSWNVSPDLLQHITWMLKVKDPTAFDGLKTARASFMYQQLGFFFHPDCMKTGGKNVFSFLHFLALPLKWSHLSQEDENHVHFACLTWHHVNI